MRTILLPLTGLLLTAVCIGAQDRQQPVTKNIETYIDRFELRRTDLNTNGWAHYYIPKNMGDTLTVKMSCVYAGKQTHPPHTHNEDESFYIIQGPVVFHINGEERILNTGDFIYTPSGSYHNIQRANDADTIKYLVLKRETTGPVPYPHPVGKPSYTYDDCVNYASRNVQWVNGTNDNLLLLDKLFADGFQVAISRVTTCVDKVFENEHTGTAEQTAIYVVAGEADVTLDGQSSYLEADNTLYCPKGSAYTLRKKGEHALVFLTITTE